MKAPRKFFEPLAIGAPRPYRELPSRLERMIHFVPPHNEKVRAKAASLRGQVDVVLGNLEDAIPIEAKDGGARRLHRHGAGDRFRLDRPMGARQCAEFAVVPRRHDADRRRDRRQARRRHAAEGRRAPGTSISSTSIWPCWRRATALKKPILVHAILETAEGVNNVEAIAAASPRMHGMSLGPGRSRRFARDEDDAGRRRPSRLSRARRRGRTRRAARASPAGSLALHDRAHGRRLRGQRHQAVLRAVRRFRRRRRLRGAVPQRLPARLRRRLDAASEPDRHRQDGLLARSGRSRLRRARSSPPCRTARAR